MGFTKLTVIFTLGISLKLCMSEPQGDKWGRQGTFPQTNYQNNLLSIEQRLRGLDTIRHIVSHNEISLGAISSRIELIETKFTGLQSTMQHKFEALAAAVSSAEMKHELLINQATRTLQTDIDRINHKLNSAEARLETTINKIQNEMEIKFQKLEAKQMNIANEVTKIHSGLEILKAQSINTELRHNRTVEEVVNHLQEIRHAHADKKEHLKNLTSLVTSLQTTRSEGWTQSDAPMIPKQHIQIIKAEINSETQKISSKMSNMYNDMWKNIKDLEVILKLAFNENNNKSREFYEDLHQMLMKEKEASESYIDVILQSVLSLIQNELNDWQSNLSTDFQRLIHSHEIHGDTCRKLKSLIENNIGMILVRLYDTIDNRTDRFSKQILEVQELVKNDSKLLKMSISKINNNIVTLAQESSEDHKKLDDLINDVTDKTDDISIDTQEINKTLLKHQKILKDIKDLTNVNLELIGNKSLHLSNETTDRLKAISANYSHGVIKILTDPIMKNENTTENNKTKVIGVPITNLNQIVSTSDLVTVIKEPDGSKQDTSTSALATGSEEKDTNRDDEDDFEAQEEFSEDDTKTIDQSQLMLSYIKYLKGHLTANEFLEEAVPGSKYDSLQDMAKKLKRLGCIPKEMIRNIEEMAQEQIEKEFSQIEKEMILHQETSQLNKYEPINDDYDETDDIS